MLTSLSERLFQGATLIFQDLVYSPRGTFFFCTIFFLIEIVGLILFVSLIFFLHCTRDRLNFSCLEKYFANFFLLLEIFFLKVEVAGEKKSDQLRFGRVGACSKERKILRKTHIFVFQENASCDLFWRLFDQKIVIVAFG
jgi:hypothetical protein